MSVSPAATPSRSGGATPPCTARTWKSNLLPNFFEPVFYLLAIGIGVGAYVTEMGGMSYAAFLAPGLVCVAAMNGASFEVTYNFFVRLNFEKAYDADAHHAARARRHAGGRGALGADARARSTGAPSSLIVAGLRLRAAAPLALGAAR